MYVRFQPCSFVFVSRCAKVFADGVQWAFQCSCDPVKTKLLCAIDTHIEMKLSVFEDQHNPCVHIKALKVVVKHFDALHDISPAVDLTGMCCLYHNDKVSTLHIHMNIILLLHLYLWPWYRSYLFSPKCHFKLLCGAKYRGTVSTTTSHTSILTLRMHVILYVGFL